MDLYGFIWIQMDLYVFIWIHTDLNGFIWIHEFFFNGFIWIYMDSNGFIWVYMDSYGFKWIYMDSYGFLWVYMNLYGFIWIYIDSYGFIWIYGYIMAYPWIDPWSCQYDIIGGTGKCFYIIIWGYGGDIFGYPKRRHPEIIHNLSPWLRLETNADLGVPHFRKPHRSYYILIQVIIDEIFPMIPSGKLT